MGERSHRTRGLVAVAVPVFFVACSGGGSKSSPVGGSSPPTPGGPRPDFGELVELEEPPPPISGGTLATDPKLGVAVAADSDRDRVYVVDLVAGSVRHTIQLAHKSEPGRVALDGSNRAHVVLRNSGEIATIDLGTGSVSLRAACTAPRGVAFDPKAAAIYVACATGELLVLPTAGGSALRRTTLGRDLRDVAVVGDKVYATRFRAAHIVDVDSGGRGMPFDMPLGATNLAWRAVAAPTTAEDTEDAGDAPRLVAVVTQDPAPGPVRTEPGGYARSGGPPSFTCLTPVGVVSTRLWLTGDAEPLELGSGPASPGHGSVKPPRTLRAGTGSVLLPAAVLPVDVATNGREFVVVAAGNANTAALSQLHIVNRAELQRGIRQCVPTLEAKVPGQAVSAAFSASDGLVVQTREPAALLVMSQERRTVARTIVLATDSRKDTGHAIFHSNAGGSIACASCHPEGADDGRVWNFVGIGPRRTPSLLGTTAHTEPFHWSGDMADLGTLVDHVFVERMSGPRLDAKHVGALGNFLFTLPPPLKLRLEHEVPPRGRELFEKRCSSCHAGESLTNNKSVDVGTGGVFQVPSLVGVGWRAPFLHSGCALTLLDRFDPSCGGNAHGDTKDLGDEQKADIVSFLETL